MNTRRRVSVVAAAVLMISVGVILALGAPSGAYDTTVVDGTGAAAPNPGDLNVTLQDITITDDGGPGAGDTFPTQIETITITRIGGGTLPDSAVTNLRLFRDSDGSGAFNLGDAQVGSAIANPNLTAGVTFGTPGTLLLQVADDAAVTLFVVADIAYNYPGIADGQTITVSFSASADDNLIPGVASSGFLTALPVNAGAAITTDFATGGDTDSTFTPAAPAGSINRSDTNVVILNTTVDDRATTDVNPTQVDTITIMNAGTATDAMISSVSLWLDRDGDGAFTVAGDSPAVQTIVNPSLSSGVTFGTPGTLLLTVPSGTTPSIFVTADMASTGLVDGRTILINITGATAKDNLPPPGVDGISSDFTPALVSNTAAIASAAVPIDFATGGTEATLADISAARTVFPGKTTDQVLQTVTLTDTGAGDGVPTDIETIVITKTTGPGGSTVPDSALSNLRLYRESNGTAGFQTTDTLIGGPIASPNLVAGATFGTPSALLTKIVNGTGPVNFYIVADFSNLVEGQTLTTITTVNVHDDLSGTGSTSSEFAGHSASANVAASSPVTLSASAVSVGSVTLSSESTVDISIDVPSPGLGEMQGRFTFDPNVVQVAPSIPIQPAVYGEGAYQVLGYNVNNILGYVDFALAVVGSANAITSGVVLHIKLDAKGAAGSTSPLGLNLSVFRDINGSDLTKNVNPGQATVTSSGAPVPNRGDVNDDGSIDITDARCTAEYGLLGSTSCSTFLPDRADVNNDGSYDITDARYIAEAGLGMRTLSTLEGISGVVGHRPTGTASPAEVTVGGIQDGLVVAVTGVDTMDIQGTLSFDPAAFRVLDVVGVNGFTVLAKSIDNITGTVSFAAAAFTTMSGKQGEAIRFVIDGSPSDISLDLDVLRTANGSDIPYKISFSGIAPTPLVVSSIMAYPNPVASMDTVHFVVEGQGIDSVKVEVFDLAGSLVFDSGFIAGKALEWHLMSNDGLTVANGVYLYVVTVKGYDGTVIRSEVRKLVVLR